MDEDLSSKQAIIAISRVVDSSSLWGRSTVSPGRDG